MRMLTTLYVSDHRARISSQSSALIVHDGDGGWTRVPLEALEAVVLAGHCQITTNALAACVQHRVRVSSLRRNGGVRFSVGAGVRGNVHLRMAQYRAVDSPVASTTIARWIVAGKLQNLRLLLARWSWDAQGAHRRALRRLAKLIEQRIHRLQSAPNPDVLRGHEGYGTKVYFRGLRIHLAASDATIGFDGRNRRPPRDPANAALGFAYGLLLTEVSGAVEAVGLDPQLGFLHGARPGRPSLALDLLEELRPSIADRCVAGLITRRMLKESDFVYTAGHACYLSDAGRRTFVDAYEAFKSIEVMHPLLGRKVPRSSLPLVQATLMARHLRGDLPAYPPYVMTS